MLLHDAREGCSPALELVYPDASCVSMREKIGEPAKSTIANVAYSPYAVSDGDRLCRIAASVIAGNIHIVPGFSIPDRFIGL